MLRIVEAIVRLEAVARREIALARNNLDSIDRKILAALQRDAAIPMPRIADLAGLTASACWRRVQKLEEAGVIDKRVTLLSARALGLAVSGFVMIRTRNHGEAWLGRFVETVSSLPAVVELHRTTGNVDYLLKFVVADLEAYNQLYQVITQLPDLTEVTAALSMEAIKATTALPLD